MVRSVLISLLTLLALVIQGCALYRVDSMHPLVRSPYIRSEAQEKEVLSRAKLETTADGRIRVLYVSGTPYERGYQHGVLLRDEVQANLGFLFKTARQKFVMDELFAEVYERMRPFIPQEYVEEMHGLAHGAKMPLHVIHAMHILPEIGEWGGKREVKNTLKAMMRGELGTSCSNLAVSGSATPDGGMLSVRILDWGLHRISKLHEYPLITIGVPDSGYAYANIGWVGFLGAVSGMNEEGITLGEMGYGDPENETLLGTPMPFVLREVMTRAASLSEVRSTITKFPGTNSFGYLMSDGKAKEAEMYIRDRDRFLVFSPGADLKDNDEFFPGIHDTIYGGHFEEVMADALTVHHGKITAELLMKQLIPAMAMQSNFQNVIYDPTNLQFWVNNAANPRVSAKVEPYSHFDLKAGLAKFRAELPNK
jgi:isopenicillin-N N-acyltransferase-like protein